MTIPRPIIVLLVLLASGCQTIHVERPRAVAPPGSVEAPAPPLELAWEYNAAAGFGPGAPLVVRDQLLVGTRKGEIHAIDLESGKRRGYRVFNDAIEGAPVLAEGTLFVTSAWGNRALQAFDPDRSSVRWRVDGVPTEVPAIVEQGTVVIVDVEGVVRAYNAVTGDALWQVRLGERVSVQAAPVRTAPGRYFMATDTGRMLVMDIGEGRITWQIETGLPVMATPASDGDVVIVPTTRGVLLGLDAASGTERWRLDLGIETARFGAATLSGPGVFIGASDGRVRHVDARTGYVAWARDVGAVVTAPPLVSRDVVWVGTMGRRLMALDSGSGMERWTYDLKGRVKSAMAAVDDALYVLTEPRYVLKFVPTDTAEESP